MIFRLVLRYLKDRKARTLLTMFGVATAMVLFIGVASLSDGLDQAMSGSETARTLIVYRQNRYCPQTSFLPLRYTDDIERVPGVASVLPVRVTLNNCRASLDLVTFEGVPVDRWLQTKKPDLLTGDLAVFQSRANAALVGRSFANRRGLEVGQLFKFGDIEVLVAGIFASAEPIQEGVIVTHLEFLQRQGAAQKLNTVTQYEVKLAENADAATVAKSIDDQFRTAEEPTDTRQKALFLATATADLRELLHFGKVFGAVCVIVVLVLVANTVLMAVHERRRHLGVLLTLGYRGRDLLWLVLAESLTITLAGAAIGITAALAMLHLSSLSVGVEGVSVSFSTSPKLVFQGLGLAVLLATLAALPPAIRAARTEPVQSLRSL